MATTLNWNLPQFEGDGYFNYAQLNNAFSTIDAAIGPKIMKSNTNLIINGDFRNPVNRRNLGSYSNMNEVAIDCWLLETTRAKITINSGYLRIGAYYNINDQSFLMTQSFKYPEIFIGKQVTISILVKEISGTNPIKAVLQWANNDTYVGANTITLTEGLNTLTVQIANDAEFNNIKFGFNATTLTESDYIDVYAVKVEFGPNQTLAYQDSDNSWKLIDLPDYAKQYALCSQYSNVTGTYIGNIYHNTNILDNAYWVNSDYIINQRGSTTYEWADTSSSEVYTIDRWAATYMSVSVTDSGLTLTSYPTTKTSGWIPDSSFLQRIKKEALNLNSIYTFSAIINGQFSSVSWRFSDDQGGITEKYLDIRNLDNTTWTVVFGSAPDYWYVGFVDTARPTVASGTTHSITITAAKLEIGPISSLAYMDNGNISMTPPPDKTLELMKCLAYQCALSSLIKVPGSAWTNDTGDGARMVTAYFSTPVPMRINGAPRIDINSVKVLYNSTYYTPTDIALTCVNTNIGCTVDMVVPDDIPNNAQCVVVIDSRTTDNLLYDCNL